MSITPFLKDRAFGPDDLHAMGIAFDDVRQALQLNAQTDILNTVVANKIIKLAQCGVHDPSQLRDMTLQVFRHRPK